jgi:hypothetical protein
METEEKIFKWGIMVGTICVFLFCMGIGINYTYNKNIGTYVKLADDASTAQAKLDYLLQYRDSCDSKIKRNEAKYIFKTQQKTKNEQLKIIDTLIVRLKDTVKMNPQSFEYQTAMGQLTGQEFETTLKTTDYIMYDCYIRSNPLKYLCCILFTFDYSNDRSRQ